MFCGGKKGGKLRVLLLHPMRAGLKIFRKSDKPGESQKILVSLGSFGHFSNL